MKSAALLPATPPSPKKYRKLIWDTFLFLAVTAVGLLWEGCAKPIDTPNTGFDLTNGESPANAQVSIVNQCPRGTLSHPLVSQLVMGQPSLNGTLAQPLPRLFISASCKSRSVTLRYADRTMDNYIEVMPDDTFSYYGNAGVVSLTDDGTIRHAPCTTPTELAFFGKLDCSSDSSDTPTIRFVARWDLNANDPSLPPQSQTEAHACHVPSGSYLRTALAISQCQ